MKLPVNTPSSRLLRHATIAMLLLGTTLLGACESKTEPDFSYSDGSAGYYSDFTSQWLLINYWAEWCKPCIQEIPELNAFAAGNKGKLTVIGINYDKMPEEREREIIKKLGIEFPVARAHIHDHYGFPMPLSLPSTVIISPEGKVHRILLGPQTSTKLAQALEN